MSHPSESLEMKKNRSTPVENKDNSETANKPTELTTTEKRYLQKLISYLEAGMKTDFIKEYSASQLLKNNNHIQIQLLTKAIYSFQKPEDKYIIDYILLEITDITDIYKENEKSSDIPLIEAVCLNQSFDVYLLIVRDKRLDLPKKRYIVETLISSLKENLFDEWFYNLYYLPKKIDLNMVNGQEETLLRKALLKRNKTAVRRLLKEGAYIGHENYFNTEHELQPEDVEDCFDNCIKRGFELDSKRIDFDYKNLVPPKGKDDINEMLPLTLISNSNKYLHLLKHPLIRSFMCLKFQRVAKFLYINLFFYFFYLASIASYIIFVGQHFESVSLFLILARWFTVIGIIYLIIREAVQLLSPKEYLIKPDNYIELILIILSIWIITMETFKDKEIFVVLVILLAGTEFCLLVGNLPILSISTHMLMLKEVLKSFLRGFLLYSIFFFMFALSFYVLFGNDGKEQDKNKFRNIFTSLVKTTAMFIGELDLEGLEFKTSIISYILFFIFVICMTVVLMNLLNGLAVNDIQVIRNQAELNGLICRAHFLKNHDIKLFPQHHEYINKKKNSKPFFYKNYVFGIKLDNNNSTNKIISPIECLSQNDNNDSTNNLISPSKCSTLANLSLDDKNSKHTKINTRQWVWYRFFEEENIVQMLDLWFVYTPLIESSVVEAATDILKNKLKSKNDKNQFKNIEDELKMIAKNETYILKRITIIEKILLDQNEEKKNMIENNAKKCLENIKK